jgi:butyryl-CoA dehydrogenase
MEFSLTDEQVMFRDMAREFAQRHIEPVAKDDDRNGYFRWETVKQLAPLGL